MAVVSGGVGGAQRLDRHACRERIAHRRVDIVDAGGLDDRVRRAVDEIGVVAAQALQRVDARSAVQNVIAAVPTIDGVGEGVADAVDGDRVDVILDQGVAIDPAKRERAAPVRIGDHGVGADLSEAQNSRACRDCRT